MSKSVGAQDKRDLKDRKMPSVTELIGDWSFIRRIGAEPSTRPFEPVPIPPTLSETTKKLIRGETVSLDEVRKEWEDRPLFLDERSLPFVFYISDQHWYYRSSKGYKFHFKWCSTLEHMQSIG